MNITINRMEMLDTARRMASIAPADSPLDVLHGVLLEADAGSGRLALTATSLELALMEQLPCTAVESGTFAIDAQMLTGMVEKLPEDTVEIIPSGGRCGRNAQEPGVPITQFRSGPVPASRSQRSPSRRTR